VSSSSGIIAIAASKDQGPHAADGLVALELAFYLSADRVQPLG